MWFSGFGVFFFCFGALSAPELFSADCTFLPPLRFLKNSTFPFDALTPSGHFAGRAGALPFLLLQKRRQKSRLKGALRPLENPLACGRARVPSAQPREGRAELLAAYAAGASALDLLRRCRFVRLLALSHALLCCAHDRQKKFAFSLFARKPGAHAPEPQNSSAETPAPKERGVPPFPRANCVRSTRQRDRQGESQRGRSPLWPVFAYFLLVRK